MGNNPPLEHQLPVLEDPTYPGRSGGYIARITGKLLKGAALDGCTELHFPPQRASTVVSAMRAGRLVPLFAVPDEFYDAVRNRICTIFGSQTFPAKVISYEAENFTMGLLPSTAGQVLRLSIQRRDAEPP